jgi:predicted MFS family arabinose efflux permease
LILWGAVGIALNVGLARFTYGVMLPSLRRDLGLDYFASGSLNTIHLGGYLIGTLIAPALGRRMATWRMSRDAHLLIVAGAIACALAPANAAGYLILAAGRLATGIGAGVGILAIFVIVYEAVSIAKRPLVSAIVWAGMNVAIIGSGLCVSYLVDTAVGWRVAFAVTAAVALAVALAFPPADRRTAAAANPSVAADVSVAKEKMLSARWLFLVFAYFFFGIGYLAYATFAGVRLSAIGASAFTAGSTWVTLGIASMIGSFATFMLLNSARVKNLALIAALSFGAAGSIVASGDSAAAALLGALLVGVGLAATPTIVIAYVRERSPDADYTRAFSVASAMLAIGQMVGPVTGGALGDWFGSAAIPLFAAAAYALGALAAAADAEIMRRRA